MIEAGGYETFNSTTTSAMRQNMQARWKDALKRSFELAKFDPRYKEDEKPKALKKPRFVKVSTIKPEQKGLNLQLKVVKQLVCSIQMPKSYCKGAKTSTTRYGIDFHCTNYIIQAFNTFPTARARHVFGKITLEYFSWEMICCKQLLWYFRLLFWYFFDASCFQIWC